MFMNEKTNKLIKSICEVNIDGKMGLLSLYDDLPHFEYDLTIDNLEDSNKKLKILIQELKQQIKKLENENLHFKSLNLILSKNISSLYKTAKTEIRRKDRTIEELRKSNMYASPTSKMFSYCNKLPLEKTQINQLSKEVKDTEHIIKVTEKSNGINENNNDNLTNVVIHPNNDIPKTVYYTRLCKKLAQQNQINVSKNKMPKDIQNVSTISTDNITQDKNEELDNDKNILKEMVTSSIHNDSENNPNSTLVICESNSISSDCELNTTPINQFENSEKDKENVSVQPFFTMLKPPTKLKKKIIIAPATIGVQNMLSENMKSAEKLDRSRNLMSKIQHEIIDSPKNQTLDTDIKSPCKCDSKIDDKQLVMPDKIHNQKSPTSNNLIEISKNIEVEHVSVIKEMILEKDINSQMPKKLRNSSCVTCFSPSTDIEFNISSKDNSLLINDEKELSSPTKLLNNQLDSELPIIKHVSNSTDYTLLNDPVKGSKKSFVETSKSSINIEVEQTTNRKKAIVVGKDSNNTALNEGRNSSHETCVNPAIKNKFNRSTRIVKCLSKTNEIKSSISSKQENNQFESKSPVIYHVNNFTESLQLNEAVKHYSKDKFSRTSLTSKTSVPSTHIEVEQIPIRRKTIVIEKNNNCSVLKEVKKSSHETCASPAIKNEFNRSTRIVKCLSKSNEIKSSILPKQKNNQLESNSPATNHVNNFTESIQLNETVKHSSKDKSFKTSIPSTHIEVEQIPIRRKTIVIGKDNYNTALKELRKSSYETCTSTSINKEFNSSTRIVKCLSKNNKIKPPLSPKQKNNQLESNAPATNHVNNLTELNQKMDSVEYPKSKSPKESLPGKTSIPSINIEVEQGSIFRRSSARRVIMLPRSNDNKQEIKKGRRVQLITIQDHLSQPLPSFNGAKKTEIDFSKNSIHIEKVVESSSHFYVPQIKRRRTINFGNADS